MPTPTRKNREQRTLRDFQDALRSSLDLKATMANALSILAQHVPADRGAICVTRPSTTLDYLWVLNNVPSAWFAGYTELATDDLVRQAVLRRPNHVLRDSEIAAPREFAANAWVQRSRELGMKLSHVMSVMLSSDPDWHGGITLYREERRSFSQRQKALLQEMVPALLVALRDRRILGEAVQQRRQLEWLFGHFRRAEFIIVTPPAREERRTEGTTALLDKWFPPHEQRRGSLPSPLLDQFAKILRLSEHEKPSLDAWWDKRDGENLKVSFIALPLEGDRPRQWAWVLEEVPHHLTLPWHWREDLSEEALRVLESWRRARPSVALPKRLTAREFEIALLSVAGWDAALIAEHFGCSPETVRVHQHRIYAKLGTDNLAMFLLRAFQYR